jgi:hypothetical protein
MYLAPVFLAVMMVGLAADVKMPGQAPLPQGQRGAVSATSGPEHQAELLRRRFQRWLDDNRAALTTRQADAISDVISGLTPELFRAPQDATSNQRQMDTSHKLYCVLGSELAYAFANDVAPPSPVERTWTQVVQRSIEWVVDCAMR